MVLAMPLQVNAGRGLVDLELDSPGEVAQSVALLLATRPGERRTVPGYGLPDPRGGGMDAGAVAEVVEEWEDRANPALVEQVTAGITQAVTVTPALVDPDDPGDLAGDLDSTTDADDEQQGVG